MIFEHFYKRGYHYYRATYYADDCRVKDFVADFASLFRDIKDVDPFILDLKDISVEQEDIDMIFDAIGDDLTQSFIIVSPDVAPITEEHQKRIIVPKLQEACDIIDLEKIQKDLGCSEDEED